MAGKDVWSSTQRSVVRDHHFDDPLQQAKHEQVCSGTDNLYEWSKKYGVRTAFGTDILMEPDCLLVDGDPTTDSACSRLLTRTSE